MQNKKTFNGGGKYVLIMEKQGCSGRKCPLFAWKWGKYVTDLYGRNGYIRGVRLMKNGYIHTDKWGADTGMGQVFTTGVGANTLPKCRYLLIMVGADTYGTDNIRAFGQFAPIRQLFFLRAIACIAATKKTREKNEEPTSVRVSSENGYAFLFWRYIPPLIRPKRTISPTSRLFYIQYRTHSTTADTILHTNLDTQKRKEERWLTLFTISP